MRVANDRQAPAADVAGEHEAALRTALGALEHDRRRAEDVTGLDERGANARRDVERRVVAESPIIWLMTLATSRRIVQRRGDGPIPAGEELRVLLLDVRRVGEHDRAEIVRRGRGVDRSVEAVPREHRQTARVIDVRVRQHDGVQLLEVERHVDDSFRCDSAPAPLEHPEIQRDRRAADAQEMAGAGDLTRRTEERDVHP